MPTSEQLQTQLDRLSDRLPAGRRIGDNTIEAQGEGKSVSVAKYVASLTPEERERFADLIAECSTREEAIRTGAARANAVVAAFASEQARLRAQIADLEELSSRLLDTITRLYLRAAPPRGGIS